MKRWIFCVVCLIISPILHGAGDSSPQAKIDSLKSQIKKITKSVNQKKSQRDKLQNLLRLHDQKIAESGSTLHDISVQKNQVKQALVSLDIEKDKLFQKISESKNALTELFRFYYKAGTQNSVKRLLNQDDAGKAGRLAAYHLYFTQALLNKHQNIESKLVEFNGLNLRLEKQVKNYDRLYDKNKRKNQEMLALSEKRQKDILRLGQGIQKNSRKLKRLKKNRAKLEKLAKAIAKLKLDKKRAIKPGMSFAKQKGGLRWPVKGKVVGKYGHRRPGTKLKRRGVLIATKAGVPVKAISSGSVVFADWLMGYGYVVIVEHGKNYMSLYGHNRLLLKNVGDSVKRDEIIATAGNSGRIGSSALYFEIRYKGRPINPRKWMLARKTRR